MHVWFFFPHFPGCEHFEYFLKNPCFSSQRLMAALASNIKLRVASFILNKFHCARYELIARSLFYTLVFCWNFIAKDVQHQKLPSRQSLNDHCILFIRMPKFIQCAVCAPVHHLKSLNSINPFNCHPYRNLFETHSPNDWIDCDKSPCFSVSVHRYNEM